MNGKAESIKKEIEGIKRNPMEMLELKESSISKTKQKNHW